MSKILKVVGASWLQTKISSYILGFLGVLAILALFVGQIERIQEDGNYAATVFYSEKTGYRIEYWGQSNDLADIPKGAARAYFRADFDTTGWSLLEVETDSSYPDEVQAYAAGIVEGALTWYLIHMHLENSIRAKCKEHPMEKQCDKFRDALDKSVNKWKSYASERTNEPFWHQVSLYYTQIDGIFTGWKHGVEKNFKEYETDTSDLYWLNSIAEVTEIQHKLNISLEDSTFDNLPGLSSAFLRIVNETAEDGTSKKNLYVAQNVVGSYATMTRIMKRYKLNYHLTSKDSTVVPGTSVDFAGYPGSVTSQDELYIVKGGEGHKMAITGTEVRNYNKKLWKNVYITEQVPVGPRITTANHLATNVSSWSRILARSNSGTACKQWLVVDFNKFNQLFNTSTEIEHIAKVEKKEIVTETIINNDTKHTVVHHAGGGRAKGLLQLVEQVPGRTHSADISDTFIEQTYWATYGLPFFKDVGEAIQITRMQSKYGNIFSELKSPRAIIFQRGYKNATSLESVIKLMRMNNMSAIRQSSEITECEDPVMCALERGYLSVLGVRGDILEENRRAVGVIDTKVVTGTVNNGTSIELVAISGPPFTEVLNASKNNTINKGNLATIYTNQFDDLPTINGLEIRDLVKHQQEEAEKKTLKERNKNVIKPFKWSDSEFKNKAHDGLPDLWNFGPFKPNWSW